MAHAWAAWQELLQQRGKHGVGHDGHVARVVDDVLEVGRKEARVEGVADGADAHDAVPALEMAGAVPCQGGHHIAGPVATLVWPSTAAPPT